jgi:hypothetical protein
MRKVLTFLIALAAIALGVCSPVSAQGFNGGGFNIGLGPFATASAPPTLSFVGTTAGSHSGAVETFTSVNIGTASGFTTRRIICVIWNNVTYALLAGGTPPTIGGITATVHAQVNQSSGGPGAYIFSADVPTGTTATVVVTFASSIFADLHISIYTVDDALLVSTTPQTGTGSTGSSVLTLSTSSFTESTGGFTVAGGATGATVSALGITGYTTDFGGGSSNQIDGNLSSIGSTGSVTATLAWTTTSATAAIAAASWR